MRVQINEVVNSNSIKAKILAHSATMDAYMIVWRNWDKYDINDRKVIINSSEELKVGDKIIGIGGRSGYDKEGSILKFKKIYSDRFEPFGVDWRYGFWFLVTALWLSTNFYLYILRNRPNFQK